MADTEKIPMGQEGISKEIIENEKNPLENLQKTAKDFLKEVQDSINKLAIIDESIDDKKVSTIYTGLRSTIDQAREIVKRQYNFEAALNKFLGRTIDLIWVDESGEVFYTTELAAKEIYLSGSLKDDGRLGSITVNKENLIEFDKYLENIHEKSSNIMEKRNSYKGTRDEVVTRWERNHNPEEKWYNKSRKNKKGKDTYPYRDTFWWYEDNKPYHSKKMNKGNIHQAYISIVFDKDPKPFLLTAEAEKDVKSYWEYMKSRNILNNIPGIVSGDVIFGEIQYAVKSGEFNTASIGPYIVAAIKILSLDIKTSKEIEEKVLAKIKPKSFSKEIKEKGLREVLNKLDLTK